MPQNKIFILLPDGVGLRNFAYSNFYKQGILEGLDIVFWNNTNFSLSELGFPEINIENAKINPVTDLYKNAKIQIELSQSKKKFKDTIYDSYRFPFPFNSIKTVVKSLYIKILYLLYNSDAGLSRVRQKMKIEERKTTYYQNCLQTLKKEKPSLT